MKKINSPKDLTIYGASPAFDQPLQVGRPNIGCRETFLELAGQMFERRWLTNNGPLVQEFERRVADYWREPAHRHVQRHDRAVDCHRALGLTGEVVVPSYTFVATAHAAHWQRRTPVFAR